MTTSLAQQALDAMAETNYCVAQVLALLAIAEELHKMNGQRDRLAEIQDRGPRWPQAER